MKTIITLLLGGLASLFIVGCYVIPSEDRIHIPSPAPVVIKKGYGYRPYRDYIRSRGCDYYLYRKYRDELVYKREYRRSYRGKRCKKYIYRDRY